MTAWETTARYMFRPHTFILRVPYYHSLVPHIQEIRFSPLYEMMELRGSYSKNIDGTYIDAKNFGIGYTAISLNKHPVYCFCRERRLFTPKDKPDLQ